MGTSSKEKVVSSKDRASSKEEVGSSKEEIKEVATRGLRDSRREEWRRGRREVRREVLIFCLLIFIPMSLEARIATLAKAAALPGTTRETTAISVSRGSSACVLDCRLELRFRLGSGTVELEIEFASVGLGFDLRRQNGLPYDFPICCFRLCLYWFWFTVGVPALVSL